MKNIVPLLIFLLTVNTGPLFGWGWDSHRYINAAAVDYLPAEMTSFKENREFLRQHSTDPDGDSFPSYYHYIDIDYYPEFLAGTLPHTWAGITALYPLYTVNNNGTVPWVIEDWTATLTQLLADGYWSDAMQVAAELGHYIADSHQALHLTLNYNGQLTGNDYIHSRYESTMINYRLSGLPLPVGEALYWASPIDSVFGYIDEIYPTVDLVMQADDYAKSYDPNYGSTYYNLMWAALDSATTASIHRAILDLASIWYTAWVDAGLSTSVADAARLPRQFRLNQNYPNPFNPSTTIEYELAMNGPVSLAVYSLTGQKLATLVNQVQTAGVQRTTWNGDTDFGSKAGSGVYIYRLCQGNQTINRKLLLVK
ncbi:MAG: T9SS type A sorting domain-containing protein [Candidatus Neomarinimicrobiota bacterium]